ncbi:MAG: DUF4280 domain-containing protein [Candidatus Promineifilaceae bacterium]
MLPTIVTGAECRCTFGSERNPFNVVPRGLTLNGLPIGTENDNVVGVNFISFKECFSPNNPTVWLGVAYCLPVITGPWRGSEFVTHTGAGILNMASTLQCQWNGIIFFTQSGQTGTSNT